MPHQHHQQQRSRRRVLASLVPTKHRSDPLQQTDFLAATDFFASSALSLRSTNQEPVMSRSDTQEQPERDDDEERDSSDDSVADVETQIRLAQRHWIQHQDARFAARTEQRERDQRSAGRALDVGADERSPSPSAYAIGRNNVVLKQIEEIEKLIRSAGEKLSSASSTSGEEDASSPLLSSRTCYAMALDQLTRTLQTLRDTDATSQ